MAIHKNGVNNMSKYANMTPKYKRLLEHQMGGYLVRYLANMTFHQLVSNVSLCSPALFRDDHLRLESVKLEPQGPIAEINLSPRSRCGPWESHGTNT